MIRLWRWLVRRDPNFVDGDVMIRPLIDATREQRELRDWLHALWVRSP